MNKKFLVNIPLPTFYCTYCHNCNVFSWELGVRN